MIMMVFDTDTTTNTTTITIHNNIDNYNVNLRTVIARMIARINYIDENRIANNQ